MKTVYLRDERKAGERRSPLTPASAKRLIDAGVNVYVEASATRVFADTLFQEVGAEVTTATWESMPQNTLILGLKELPLSDEAVSHQHIYFAHAYKGQDEAKQILTRFNAGQGCIFDLEFLTDSNNHRIAAFGYWAGFVGAGLALLGQAHYQKQTLVEFPEIKPFVDKDDFIREIKRQLGSDIANTRVMVMGALGRCGTGASDLLAAVGIRKPTLWDMAEYDAAEKPVLSILDHDVFINCVYLTGDIPPMIDQQRLSQNNKLRIISDVSCDPNSANNPLPVYDTITCMTRPFVQASGSDEYPVFVQAIDHLPSLLPKESSEAFAGALLPYLVELCREDELPAIWEKALGCFEKARDEVLN
nr:saccharopine dehydrogenase [Endozoicomonas sp.]